MLQIFSTVPDFKVWFPVIEEFPRPDWKAIRAWIGQNVSVDRLDDAWQAITREWLQRICERLGSSYVVAESQSFHLVSELDEAKQIDLLSFLERARARILRQLGDIRLPKSHGKHVVLRFSEDEDYYRYIAYFHPDGEYADSAGNFLRRGYRHIAYPHRDIPMDGPKFSNSSPAGLDIPDRSACAICPQVGTDLIDLSLPAVAS